MTLFAIGRSPLMIGADFLTTPQETIAKYFQNAEIIAVNQASSDNRQVFKNHAYAVWTATEPVSGDRYIALFNLADKPATVTFDMEHESLRGDYKARDLWSKSESVVNGTLSAKLGAHDATIFRLTKVK